MADGDESALIDPRPGPTRRVMDALCSSSLALGLVSTAIFLALWEIVRVAFSVPDYILPPLSSIADELVSNWQLLWQHGLVTLTESVIAFVVAVVVGTLLAVLIAFSGILERLIYPPLVVSQAVPKVALAPLFLVWFGFGMTSKIAIGALIAVFPVVIDTVVGLRSIDPEMVRMGRVMRASPMKIFWRLRLPTASPSIFAGMKMAITFAVTGAVVGEFVSGTEGLGYLVQSATGLFNTTLAFAAIVVLSAMGVGLFALVSLIERRVLAWHPSTGL
jgi:NitT/TauT family transport system permease protein